MVVVWGSDGMPASLAVTSVELLTWAGVGARKLLRKGAACLLPRFIAPDC